MKTLRWRPIDSAPKDGTPVLLWAPKWTSVGYGWFDKNLNSGDPGWTDGGAADWGRELNTHLWPTHWMPLPSLPCAKKVT